jgi:hypothetical protein
MQFKVPQFLDIEDKIFGPFTFSQFAYLAGGAGLCFVLFKLLGFLLGAIPILAVAGIALALTFYRPNNKPLANMIEASFKYVMQDKLYIWERRTKKNTSEKAKVISGKDKENIMDQNNVRLTGSKLADLAWGLDVLDLKKGED